MEKELLENEKTIIFGNPEEESISADELRSKLGLPDTSDIRSFKNISTIGMGGLGAVFSAQEPGLNRNVALKMLRPEFRNKPTQIESFIREARTTAQIDHPNIVPVHSIGVFDDIGVFFTMKHIEGESLRAVIKKLASGNKEYIRKYSLSHRLNIFIDICNAIAYAHNRGVIHCDLKPANVMLGEFGEVMLMDWGIATYNPENDSAQKNQHLDIDLNFASHNETVTLGNISGTPAFMAPEQVLGSCNELSDIYSLGAILYSILTLHAAPFDYRVPTDTLLQNVVDGRFQRPRRSAPKQHIPRELEAITLKAMSQKPENRYQNVQSLISDIRNFLDKYPVNAYRKSWLYHSAKLCIRRPLIPCTILAALLSYGGVKAHQSYQNYIATSSIISLINANQQQGSSYYLFAKRMAGNPNYKDSKELENNIVSFLNYSRSEQESLWAINQISPNNLFVISKLRELIVQEIELCILSQNYDLLANQIRQFESRWRDIMGTIIGKNQKLADTFALVDKLEGKFTVLRPVGSKIWLNNDEIPETSSTQTLAKGSYQLFQRDISGATAIIPFTIDLAQLKIINIENIPTVPEGMVYISNYDDIEYKDEVIKPFFMAKNEVTFGEYIEFWKSLDSTALKSKYRGIWLQNDQEYIPLWSEKGELIEPFTIDMPVRGITGNAAKAYCQYISKKSGINYRLPLYFEWILAAQGSDHRPYIWGDQPLANGALTSDCDKISQYPYGAPVGIFATDISPYGVNDMAGNVREFTCDHSRSEHTYQIMGGSFLSTLELSKIGSSGNSILSRFDVGFRVAADVKKEDN